eukprot:GHVP01003272.1.p1 GENE.GHVP01003272.1~~GHVP01003272.1.p1  ORF type:complete len:522 (-),score=120.29 GHVP01003272.1:329-1894(-)
MEFENLFLNPFSRLYQQDDSFPTNDVESNRGSRNRRHSSQSSRQKRNTSILSPRGLTIVGGTMLILSIVGWAWKNLQEEGQEKENPNDQNNPRGKKPQHASPKGNQATQNEKENPNDQNNPRGKKPQHASPKGNQATQNEKENPNNQNLSVKSTEPGKKSHENSESKKVGQNAKEAAKFKDDVSFGSGTSGEDQPEQTELDQQHQHPSQNSSQLGAQLQQPSQPLPLPHDPQQQHPSQLQQPSQPLDPEQQNRSLSKKAESSPQLHQLSQQQLRNSSPLQSDLSSSQLMAEVQSPEPKPPPNAEETDDKVIKDYTRDFMEFEKKQRAFSGVELFRLLKKKLNLNEEIKFGILNPNSKCDPVDSNNAIKMDVDFKDDSIKQFIKVFRGKDEDEGNYHVEICGRKIFLKGSGKHFGSWCYLKVPELPEKETTAELLADFNKKFDELIESLLFSKASEKKLENHLKNSKEFEKVYSPICEGRPTILVVSIRTRKQEKDFTYQNLTIRILEPKCKFILVYMPEKD